MILYFCPDLTVRSAGIRILYRHVEILQSHGFDAAILHQRTGFRAPDMPAVPIRYLDARGSVKGADILVIPETAPDLMEAARIQPVRRMIIALNWRGVYWAFWQPSRPRKRPFADYRDLGIEGVITHSAHIADYVGWAMGIRCQVFTWGIKPQYYYLNPGEKTRQVTFIKRKRREMAELQNLLHSRNPAFLEKIQWVGLDGLSEADYAAQIRRSALFINLSEAEGLPCSLLEAMRSGTIVAGYNSVGGQRELIGAGPNQNCLLAENLDYPTVALQIEPFLNDMISGDLAAWKSIQENGLATSAPYTPEAEDTSVAAIWRGILQK